MNSKIRRLLLSTVLLSLIGPSTFADFEKTSAHIDTDGAFIAHIDFSGDGAEIAQALTDIHQKLIQASPQIPPIPINFEGVFDSLGFGALQSIGFSSKEIAPGLHRNISVALFREAPAGLYAIYGSEPREFTAAQWAPADAHGAVSMTLDLEVLETVVSQTLTQLIGPMGQQMCQHYLSQPIPQSDLSYGELVNLFSGHWDLFWRQSYEEGFEPVFKFWIRIEGAGSALSRAENTLSLRGALFEEVNGGARADLTPLLGPTSNLQAFAMVDENDDLILYSDEDWGRESHGPRLAQAPEFQPLAARLPTTAIAFNYSRGSDLKPIIRALETMPATQTFAPPIEATLTFLIGDFLKPSIAATQLKGNLMRTEQYAAYSTKQVLASVPTLIGGGLTAAMAIPAFQKVRATSQEKTVMNNLRQLDFAAQQYFLETGASSVKASELVGPDGYIYSLPPVAGEDYLSLTITPETTFLEVTLNDGRSIRYQLRRAGNAP